VLCVRINAWDTPWTYGDVIDVVTNAGPRLDEVMLPKVQSRGRRVALDLLLTQVEKNAGWRRATSASRPRSRRPGA
jgi:citrate lyase subunit beta / citryl-CoA lyase